MSKFQLALLIAFGFFLVVAVLVFAFYRGGGGGSRVSEVVVWGDISAYDVNVLFNETQFHKTKTSISAMWRSHQRHFIPNTLRPLRVE